MLVIRVETLKQLTAVGKAYSAEPDQTASEEAI